MQNASEKAKNIVKNASGSTVALDSLTRSSKAAAIGMKALSIAGNMLVSMAIFKGIELLVSLIDNYANRVKYAQERLDEFSNTVSESKNNLATQEEWIKEHGKRYEQLSQKVDNYGHVISMTSDEISEYNSLTKDIESMFPTMVTGYNDQNQAIIKMKGSVDTLTESYKENVEAAYATTLAKSGENFGDYKTGTLLAQNQKKQIDEIISGKAKLKNVIVIDSPFINDGDNGLQKDTNGFITGIDTDILDEDTIKQLQEETKDVEKTFDQLSISLQQKIRAALTTANATIKTETAKIKPLLEAFVYGNSGKSSGYGELGEEGKQVIRNVISNLDDTFYEQFDSDSDMASYFYSHFIDPLKDGLDNTDLAVKINTLFSLNQNDYKSYQEYINAINDIINQIKGEKDSEGNPLYSEEQIASLQNALGVGKVNKSGQLSGQSLIDTVKDKYSSINEADKFIETLNEKELRVLYDLKPDESKSLDNLKNAIQSLNDEASKETDETTVSTTLSFSEAWKAIGTSGDEKADKKALEAKEELLELAKAGKLTEEAFSKSNIAENFLKDTKLSAREATQEINELISSADQLSSMKTGISSISTILGEKKENQSSKKTRTKGIGADTLAGMPEDIKKQKKEYEHFVEVLGDGMSSMDNCREAANKLATAYVTSGNFLSNLTDENQDYYKSVLDEMGVENAATIVEDTLTAKKQVHELETKALAAATKDMGKKTSEATDEFVKHAEMSNLAKVELADLAAKERIFNSQTLSTSEKVKELNKLAQAYFGVSNAIQISSAMGSDPRYYKNPEDYEKSVQEQWDKIVKKHTKVAVGNVSVKSDASKSKGSSKKGKSDKSKSKQQFDWISRALDRLSSRLDLVKAKYDSLFTGKKIKNSDSLLKKQNRNLDKQYKLLQKTEKYQEKAQKKYTKKANSIKLDASLKKAVREGRIKGSMKQLIATYGEKKAEKIQKYQDWYETCHFA